MSPHGGTPPPTKTMPPAAASAGRDKAWERRSHPAAAWWPEQLRALHAAVRREVAASSAVDLGRRNAKGDLVKDFDLAADRTIAEFLEPLAVPLVLETEEGPSRMIGGEPPEWRLIADPVDGSDNRTRGLPLSAFSCAVLPAGTALQPEAVVAAIVGPMEHEDAWVATVGAGARHGSARITTSTAAKLAEAMVSVELNHCHPSPALGRVMGMARGVRSYGCASRALALVAAGAIDAHMDIRGRLTIESWLAGGFLVQEAGGCVMSPDGGPVPAPTSLIERRSLIAGATPELCREIVRELGSHDV